MTKRTTATLMVTIVALKRALSLMPITRIAVITSAIKKAGTLSRFHIRKDAARSAVRALAAATRAIARLMIADTFCRKAWVPGTSVESDASAIWRATMFSAA